jgi:hypothetical protein
MMQMKKTALAVTLNSALLFLIITGTLLVFSHEFTICALAFSTSEIEAEITVTSPVNNGSYTGDVCLDVNIHFFAWSRQKNSSMIPYQDVACLYKVDSKQYQNASIYYASKQSSWVDIPNGGYWNEMRCNYTASLQGLSDGPHSLKIALEPSDITYYRVNAPSTFDNIPTEYFYVYQITTPAQPTNSTPEFPATIIAASGASLTAVIAAGLLVYFKKHKR